MKENILNYSILIEEDARTGTGEPCFSAFSPLLGVADSGDTVEEALERIEETIKFHLQCLVAEGEEIPTETNKRSFFSTIQVLRPNVA